MEEWVPPTLLFGAGALVVLWMMNSFKASRIGELEQTQKHDRQRQINEVDRLNQKVNDLTDKSRALRSDNQLLVNRNSELNHLIDEKTKHFPWLATALADYQEYWAQEKTIHEKHVFQLFGTVIEYIARSNTKSKSLPLFGTFEKLSDVRPGFVTSTTLSDKANDFANLLEVEVRENVALRDYPIIKCNISKRNGDRVYHMPFDQQYDRTIIEPDEGEIYASTAAEAETKGFRRAYRWHSDQRD